MRLSLVVPVYAVEQWLPSCLDSIAAQTFADYELVVVDDGSPDGSVAIVEERAVRDPRIRLVRQVNSGLGAARNAGVAAARGELLAFADSDDTLPPDALRRMVETIDRTGSDMVVGSVERVSPESRWVLPRVAANHATERLGITLREQPLMLADVFAWNKLYRRDFWDRAGLGFPVGVAYEDQPAATRAFLAARRFDVLTEVVYHWHVRSGSISSKRDQVSDLDDRLKTKRASAALVEKHGDPAVTRVLYDEVLPVDMWEYFRAAAGPATNEAYWTMLRDGVRELWNAATVPFEQTKLPVRQRLMGWLTVQDRRDDLVKLVAFLDALPGAVPVRDGRYEHPWADEPGLPAELVVV